MKEYSTRVTPWKDTGDGPLAARVYELIELTDDVEVWVIHWPSGGHLQLHDHGGSTGAFWVVSGSLEELYISSRRSASRAGRRRHPAGGGAGFGGEYVHDVRSVGLAPTTSVHAYSPPMPGMTYYRLPSAGGLAAERTEYRSDPSWAP